MLKKLLFSLTLLIFATFSFAQSIGIIGSATPDGWDADTDMIQDAMNPDIWTISMELVTGAAKFRQDDDWAINWGAVDFPSGTGEQDGPDIPVPGGSYDITFNSATGEYTFVYTGLSFVSIGIIGTGTPNGNFDTDIDMTQDPLSPQVWTIDITLTMADVKFRANDDWADNWGASDWPTGVGTPGGDNIPCEAGDWGVTFNTHTGEYSFELLIPVYDAIGLVGDATPGGWSDDTYLTQNPSNVQLWSGNITLVDGAAKFRADTAWTVNWGDTLFVCGTGVQDGGDIPALEGEYNVEFNSTTGEYCFNDPISIFSTIGVIGNGTGLGWDNGDIDMYQDPVQPDQWSVQLQLVDGEVKFRAEDDWAVNWGDNGFPTGTGELDGPNIPVFAGTWQIDFNATTGVYSFTPVTVGIIGTALVNGWGADEDLECSTTEGSTWTAIKNLMDGEAKFRQDDDWLINWGSDTWPTGTGTQDGSNIPVTAGIYEITVNTGTGDYSFIEGDATTEVLSSSFVKVFPNPTSNLLNISIEAKEMQKDITIQVMDLTGKVIEVKEFDSANQISIDVSAYNTGMYIVQISSDKYIVGKRFSVAK